MKDLHLLLVPMSVPALVVAPLPLKASVMEPFTVGEKVLPLP